MNDDFDWISAREMTMPKVGGIVPKIDIEVSKIVGKPVLVNDQRLMKLVVKFKKQTASSPDSERMDNYLYNPAFLKELRKTFNA